MGLVGPGVLHDEAVLPELVGHRLDGELGTDLSPEFVASGKCQFLIKPGDGDGLGSVGAQPHFDPAVLGIPQGDVIETKRIEVGTQRLVEHSECIAVELSRYSSGVVVGRDESVGVLL